MIEGSSADAAQPEKCEHWSLVSPKHSSVNLGFSLRIAQQDSSAKYRTVDLISSVITPMDLSTVQWVEQMIF